MNNTNKGQARLKWLLLAVTVVAAFCVPAVVNAQTTPPAAYGDSISPVEVPGWMDTVLAFVAGLGTKFGIVGKVFSVLATISGVCALTIKPLWDKFIFPGLTAYVQSTVSTKDDEMFKHFLANKVVKAFLYVLNILAHIKIPIVDKDGAAVSPSSAGTTLPPS